MPVWTELKYGHGKKYKFISRDDSGCKVVKLSSHNPNIKGLKATTGSVSEKMLKMFIVSF
jgi:hypothetical protein